MTGPDNTLKIRVTNEGTDCEDLLLEVEKATCDEPCPTISIYNNSESICTGDLASQLSTWQGQIMTDETNMTAVAIPNTASSIVYSTLAVPAQISAPNGLIATGVHSGTDKCAEEIQTSYEKQSCKK